MVLWRVMSGASPGEITTYVACLLHRTAQDLLPTVRTYRRCVGVWARMKRSDVPSRPLPRTVRVGIRCTACDDPREKQAIVYIQNRR